MRHPALLAALTLSGVVVLGCHNTSPTDPSFATPVAFATTQAPPSGLVVSGAIATEDPATARPAITGAGDSVVVTAPFTGFLCGLDLGASAGLADGVLVITGTGTHPDGGARCVDVARAGIPTFRAVVRAVPGGRYTVVVRERVQDQVGSHTFREREIARGVVTVQ